MRSILIICVCLFSLSLVAQRSQDNFMNKKKKELFRGTNSTHPLYVWLPQTHSRNGIQLSFGPTYTFTRLKNTTETYDIGTDSTLNLTVDPAGLLGGFAEIGMVHIAKRRKRIYHYMDWGVGYKHYGGKETYKQEIKDSRGEVVQDIEGEGRFYNGSIFGRMNFHSLVQFNKTMFLDNGLGFNLDYRVVHGNQEYSGDIAPANPVFEDKFVAQLNYDLGLGFKVSKGFFVIPGFRLPFVKAYSWDNANPTIKWFNSKYEPVLFKLKLVWLFKANPNKCNTPGMNSFDKERAKEFMNGS